MLNDAGLAVPHWPEEWGGRDWSELQRHIWHEEMQRAGVPPPLAFNASMIGPVHRAVRQRGAEGAVPARHRQPRHLVGQGFSEPDAGSDLASLRTTAVRDGDDWVVNGQKTWTTLGQHGDWIFTLVRTDPEVKKQAGISMLLIDMTSPGVEVRPIELIDGGHEVNEVWFADVRVPGDHLVGEENQGWTIAKFLLGNERVGVAPVGATKRALARLKELAADTAGDDPLVRARVAELENELLALELTALRVVAHSADGEPHPASSVLKLQGHRAAAGRQRAGRRPRRARPRWPRGAGDGLRRAGLGATRRRRRYLNLRKASIYGGSNEVQRQIIAAPILGTLRRTDMDFTYDDEQSALRDAVRGLVGKAYADHEHRRRTVAEDPGFDEKLWARMAEMGLLGLPFAEDDGGVGAGPVEIGIVCQELGRVARARAVPRLGRAGRRPGRRLRHRRAAGRGARTRWPRARACSPSPHDEPGRRWSRPGRRRAAERTATPGP